MRSAVGLLLFYKEKSKEKSEENLKQGDIKVIMVKDLSRLGRDYIGVGDYIEQIFPLMGVRFIAVNNSFDSMKLNNGTPGIEVAVSNLVNNMYSRDIAKKIRAALETNWKNGKATCTNVPFGYVWNKKGGQRWEIDPEAAPCVKKVFESTTAQSACTPTSLFQSAPTDRVWIILVTGANGNAAFNRI